MPELPEVQTVIQTLSPRLSGATVCSAEVLSPSAVEPATPQAFAHGIVGRTFSELGRRGKYIVARLDSGFLVAHLRMTGQLLLHDRAGEMPRFARVALHLDGGPCLWFSDMRKFGRMLLVDDPGTILAGLGPEPFDDCLDGGGMHRLLQRHRRPLKPLLLDQTFLAGLGNIYADEALFASGLHPTTPAREVTPGQAGALLAAIRHVLAEAIANRGTTISDYVDANGDPGDNQHSLRVYGRAGQQCPLCHTTIEGIRLSGRSSCYCPGCQQRAASPAQSP